MRTYGQYCPIARASELLAERWSVIILRNIVVLLAGPSTRWSAIPWRSPAGTWESFDGATPCAQRRSRCRALATLARSLPTWHRDHERGPQPLHRLELAGSSP